MKIGPRLARVVEKGRLGLVDFVSMVKLKQYFEAAFSRTKVCDVFASRSTPLGK
jgi:hypothetical protein